MNSSVINLTTALREFVQAVATQSQSHIRPLHQHIVQRLVIEGGFPPDEVSPRPPLRVESITSRGHRRHRLHFDESAAKPGEQTLLGGLKTKDVDAVVSKQHVGPCLAVSVKGTFNAFRNLTNRMEEAAGDCTNLHISYPALVYGFLHVMRANRKGDVSSPNDVAVEDDGTIVQTIQRYHDAMARLTNRIDLRNDVSRYEAVAITLVHPRGDNIAEVVADFPLASSPLAFERFFEKLYHAYDQRFVYTAPALESRTRRMVWQADSPVFSQIAATDFTPRLAAD